MNKEEQEKLNKELFITIQRNKKLKMELSDPEPEYIPKESNSFFLEEY